jgi:putative ABC transport system permease protein
MNDILFLAWQYLKYNWIKTIVLIASISLILFLPLGLQMIVDQDPKRTILQTTGT